MVNLIMELTQSGRCFRKKPAGCVQGDSGDQGTKLKVVAAQPQVWQMGWREEMRTHSAPPAWIPRPAPPYTRTYVCMHTPHTCWAHMHLPLDSSGRVPYWRAGGLHPLGCLWLVFHISPRGGLSVWTS